MTFFSDHSHVNSQEVVCENPWRETLSEICYSAWLNTIVAM